MQDRSIEAHQIIHIKPRRRPAHLGEILRGGQFIKISCRFQRIRSPDPRQMRHDSHRLNPVFAHRTDRHRTQTLGKRPTIRFDQKRHMGKGWQAAPAKHAAKGLENLDLSSGIGDVVFAANDMGDDHIKIIDD